MGNLCTWVVALSCCASLAAISIDVLISMAFSSLRLASVSSCFWIASLRRSHTSRSPMVSLSESPNSHCSDNRLSTATSCETDSPSSWFLWWNLNLSAIISGLRASWSFNIVTVSLSDLFCVFLKWFYISDQTSPYLPLSSAISLILMQISPVSQLSSLFHLTYCTHVLFFLLLFFVVPAQRPVAL